ncbi:MAG: DegV family protein [Clostridia bacterium]|nr:DegV family protein [Clostridia bacterium]
MNIEKIKIVADSSADILDLTDVPYATAPLMVFTSEREFVDDADLDVKEMVEYLRGYNGRSSTACPGPHDYLNAFGDAEWVFCVTITATLSGSYNAAMVAKRQYEEMHPERRVFVLNSLTAGPECYLLVEKLQRLVREGNDFDGICRQIEEYRETTGLLFMLESMKNLANNGRVSPIVAKMAGLLGIRLVGKASDRGDLEPLNKCRGEKKALETIVAHMKEMGLRQGKVRIAHCQNEDAAHALRDLIAETFERKVHVRIYRCRGLCSFYAEQGGMLVGFEKN